MRKAVQGQENAVLTICRHAWNTNSYRQETQAAACKGKLPGATNTVCTGTKEGQTVCTGIQHALNQTVVAERQISPGHRNHIWSAPQQQQGPWKSQRPPLLQPKKCAKQCLFLRKCVVHRPQDIAKASRFPTRRMFRPVSVFTRRGSWSRPLKSRCPHCSSPLKAC